MNNPDDKLLRVLGAAVRGRTHNSEEQSLERLVRGDLSDVELEQLHEQAASDPQLSAAVALYTPLSAAARSRITSALMQAQASTAERPKPTRERVASLVPPGAHRPVFVTIMCAAAALLFVSSSARHSHLPAYELEADTSDVRYRGAAHTRASASALALAPGSRIRLFLRPGTPTSERAAVHALLAYRDASGAARVLSWPGAATFSEQGAVSLQLEAAPVELQPLQRPRLIVVLAEPSQLEALSDPATGLESTRTEQGQRWSVLLTSER